MSIPLVTCLADNFKVFQKAKHRMTYMVQSVNSDKSFSNHNIKLSL